MTPLVEVDGLEKSFGELRVLRGVSFRVDEGDALGVLGPSGCGHHRADHHVLQFAPPAAVASAGEVGRRRDAAVAGRSEA